MTAAAPQRSEHRSVNAYVAAVVREERLAQKIWKKLEKLAKLQARCIAAREGRRIRRFKLTGGQTSEAVRILKAAGYDPACHEIVWEIRFLRPRPSA